MNAAALGIASDFVKAGIEKAGIPLSATLEAYLSLTFARFIGRSITVDLLTVRTAQAMDAGAPRDVIRALADECLIACAFFERRLRRNGTVRHYVGLGQASYDAARLTEQAYGFVQMRDVIASAAIRRRPEDGAGARRPRPRRQPDRPERARPAERGDRSMGTPPSPACSGAERLRPPDVSRRPVVAPAARRPARSSLPNSFITLTRTPAVQLKVKSPDMAMIGPISRHCSGSVDVPAPRVV